MWTLLEHVYFLNKQRTFYVSKFLNETLPAHVKIASSSCSVMMNQIQLFIPVTFKGYIPKNEEIELGDLCHTLSMHCGRHIRFMSYDVQLFLNKSEWSDLMELASSYMDRQILKQFKLHDDMIEWSNTCYESTSFGTPPDTYSIEFETLNYELMLHTSH
jgi:hypothetical protein